MSVSDDLNAAADVLEKDGWIRKNFHSQYGHCAVGAVEVATGIMSTFSEEGWNRYTEARDALRVFTGWDSIPEWNDDVVEGPEEVIQAMRDAATKNQTDEYRSNGVS